MDKHYQVLLVDDDQWGLYAFAVLLNKSGYTVQLAKSGDEALERLAHADYDLVLLDVMMPGLSGYEVLEKIRAKWSKTELPVIMMTVLSESRPMVKAFSLGANDYITKPVNAEVALARIKAEMRTRNESSDRSQSRQHHRGGEAVQRHGGWEWQAEKDVLYLSESWHQLVDGCRSEIEAPLSYLLERLHSNDYSRVSAIFEPDFLAKHQEIDFECRLATQAGKYVWLHCKGTLVRDEAREVVKIYGEATNITEAKKADPLTGLVTRDQFINLVSTESAANACFYIVAIGVDRLNLILDTLMLGERDQLLISIVEELESFIEPKEIVAYLGRNEFAMQIYASERSELDKRLANLELILSNFSFRQGVISVTTSIGASLISRESSNAEEMLTHAHVAMLFAQESGGAKTVYFNQDIQDDIKDQVAFTTELSHAIQAEGFEMNYQPIVNLASGRTVGFEALIRWHHKEKGWVSPAKFIPVAEKSKLIIPIGRWVIEQSCKHLHELNKRFPDVAISMSINISAVQFSQNGLIELINSMVRKYGVDAESIKLEITETALLENFEETVKVLNAFRAMGFKISIDDFGMGYSSLAYLNRLPVDVLKVDKLFIDNMLTNERDGEIVSTIINLASSLNMDVIAEGIESKQQATYLQSKGCGFGQGFYFSRPMGNSESLACSLI